MCDFLVSDKGTSQIFSILFTYSQIFSLQKSMTQFDLKCAAKIFETCGILS